MERLRRRLSVRLRRLCPSEQAPHLHEPQLQQARPQVRMPEPPPHLRTDHLLSSSQMVIAEAEDLAHSKTHKADCPQAGNAEKTTWEEHTTLTITLALRLGLDLQVMKANKETEWLKRCKSSANDIKIVCYRKTGLAPTLRICQKVEVPHPRKRMPCR